MTKHGCNLGDHSKPDQLMSQKRVAPDYKVGIFFHYDAEIHVFQVPRDVFEAKFKQVCDAATQGNAEARWMLHSMCVGTAETPYSPRSLQSSRDEDERKQMIEENDRILGDQRAYTEFHEFHVVTMTRYQTSVFFEPVCPSYVFWSIEDDQIKH